MKNKAYKKRADKYEQKIKIKGSLDELFNEFAVPVPPKKTSVSRHKENNVKKLK